MKRNGFTMVELIFVIIIIGILSVAAIPKFGDIKDRAKISTEIGAMQASDPAITSTVEYYEDQNINWHNVTIPEGRLDQRYTQTQAYNTNVNIPGKVLSAIAKKTEKFKIVGAASTKGRDVVAWGTITKPGNDILFITGPASDAKTGVKVPDSADGQDLLGKPDKNDMWVFNPNSFDINITSDSATYPLHVATTQIPAQSIGLLDVNGTEQLAPGGNSHYMRHLLVVRSDATTATPQQALEIRY
jgi:prepilin-type N-terminal cleavage/methylation domain-containing protein